MIFRGSSLGADPEKTLHRLEAFSDIVIGFCIAEMGLNLLIPQHASDYRAIATSVIGFVVSFFLIAIVWWVHQRIFRTFFILTPVTLFLNFTLLGSLVLMVYVQQIVLHFIGQGSQVVDLMRMWMTSYGVVYGLLDAMLWIGLRKRWKMLSDGDLRWGVQRASILSIGALMFFLVGSGLAGYHSGIVLIVGPIAVFALRFVVPKFVDRVIAARSSALAR
jgi:uncharacterized membrane protein